MATLLTPSSNAWPAFCRALLAVLGNGVPGRCHGDLQVSTSLLEFSPYDVEATLDYFRAHGGFCDCEVLLNVETGGAVWNWEELWASTSS
jgi:Protein of unknown function (DUF2695)